ncbi:hypothetical protein PVT68_02585 [Microbulbifer bruguierae]|uniref:Prolyl 4-hydroxylase alpha subunit Fe(2+) 2OG dioxygenase domain-containing protein n=1 Tax=Microbulbifer bruguierae TaxID=3029061 RepID=A0ABY8NE56_9GAMM|nr:hypothetical protein [Microbulbifer bruguierae]WGL17196.1 hypothetical protein PVT68_02585 [Microbulbifer bruguierae]
MNMSTVAEMMGSRGYLILRNQFSGAELDTIKNEVESLIDRVYTEQNLLDHSVYPSDHSESRVSHAMMIAESISPFPTVAHTDFPSINALLRAHNGLLSEFTGSRVSPGSRCMLNYQCYTSGSKPVAEHFDGEYLRTRRCDKTLDFQLLEGILPRYVSLLVVQNENDGKGIELSAGETRVSPVLNAGDTIIFDNIRWRHSVPRLDKGRVSIGLRNFDHMPWHFCADREYFLDAEERYVPVHDGWGSAQVDCVARLGRFFQNEWPVLKNEYSFYF